MNIGYQYQVRCREVSDIAGHLPFLHDTALRYQDPKIIELGVRSGNSTSAFLAAICEAGGHLWSADVNVPQVPEWWRELPWTVLTGDDMAESVWKVIEAEAAPADVLFIDTSHELQHTLDELARYVPMVRPGGIVLMHDTEWQGREVAAALDKFCPERGLTWVNRTGYNGLGVINIPEEAA